MPRILIIGYGNPLRTDDGLGWHAAEQLAKASTFSSADVLSCHQLTPDLAETISRSDAVILIDATRDGKPGELRSQRIEPVTDTSCFTHHLKPARLLALSLQLYGKAPCVFLISMCGAEFGHGENLSNVVQSRLPKLVLLVEQLAAELHVRLQPDKAAAPGSQHAQGRQWDTVHPAQ